MQLVHARSLSCLVPSPEAADTGQPDNQTIESLKKRIARSKLSAHYRASLPPWLLPRVRDFHVNRAICGWTFSLRSYNILGDDYPAWDACRFGDMDSLKSMLTERQMTLFNRSGGGDSLLTVSQWHRLTPSFSPTGTLQVAILCFQTPLVRFLLDLGLHAVLDAVCTLLAISNRYD
jgi:hypothetical protein